jgi:FKBP-type peptidyl-prolyl cis-trans isomerase SlyD
VPFKENQVVTIHFTLQDAEGNLLDTTEEDGPMLFLAGQEEILPKLEAELTKMNLNEKKKVVLQPEEAYGPYDPEDVHVIKRHDLPDDIEIEVGVELLAEVEEDEEVPCYISKVDGDEVTLDFNHPLAGKSLFFDVELIEVRDATEEELQHGHAHDPEGHEAD